MALAREFNDREQEGDRDNKKTVRNKSDYLWLLVFYALIFSAGEKFFPERTSVEDAEQIRLHCDPLQLSNLGYGPLPAWGLWAAVASVALATLTSSIWVFINWYDKATAPDKYFAEQMSAIRVNFVLLALMQAGWDYLTTLSISKTTMGNTEPLVILRDVCLWMLCFEITWYTQHRLMHDVKFLWNLGHSYHHGWKRPEHMIGVTNFAFDHIVEIWVTMSSSFIGYIIFPANFFVGKAISLAYMILAVFVHWDGFALSRYHLNHHYLVTKNYGSHIPIFDIFFGTYQWEDYYHPDSIYGKRLKGEAVADEKSSKKAKKTK